MLFDIKIQLTDTKTVRCTKNDSRGIDGGMSLVFYAADAVVLAVSLCISSGTPPNREIIRTTLKHVASSDVSA